MVDVHTIPLTFAPAWAVLERRLFDDIEAAWRKFSAEFCAADGSILGTAEFVDRDGVDDLYEPFFNWPAFYLLGGSDEILDAAKRHWEGVTRQLTEAGMLTDEYENGYDWFHQGESLLLFYGLCAADPTDQRFAARAARFASLYTDERAGNWDPDRRLIRAPHTGARGALVGLGPQWQAYSASQIEMRPYGLPLHHVPGIERWEDLESAVNAESMGRAMQDLAAGDVPVNLAATSLATNAWLYGTADEAAAWVRRYVDAWRVRADENGGLIPDNVSPDGVVGGLHEGRWYGGHYGWAWPHGLESIAMATLIAGSNVALIDGDMSAFDMVRTVLDTVIAEATTAPIATTPFSLRGGWVQRYGADAHRPSMLVPHRFGKDGWFDFGPMPLTFPTWLWWFTRDDADRARLDAVLAGEPHQTHPVRGFRDKAEAGHEAPWLSFIAGDKPNYPVEALSMALGQVARRVALMDAETADPATVHLHFWQRVNPVVTEVLGQLIAGVPQTLYNGALPFAAVSYVDVARDRPGLPSDVAALVTALHTDGVTVELVNLSHTGTQTVRVAPSRFGEERIIGVTTTGAHDIVHPGATTAFAGSVGETFTDSFTVDLASVDATLPPMHRAELRLHVARTGHARHRRSDTAAVDRTSEGEHHD